MQAEGVKEAKNRIEYLLLHTMPSPLQPSPSAPRARSRGSGKKREGNHPLPERSASFHGRTKMAVVTPPDLRRHKTQPDLSSSTGGRKSNISMASTPDMNWRKVPAKVLVNVYIQRSLGALQIMASTEWTVERLVESAVKQYVKEGRRPLLTSVDPSNFSLHYSQFSLEGLDPKEMLLRLGSRSFFLCPKSATIALGSSTATSEEATCSNSCTLPPSSSSSSCSNEADKTSKIVVPWLRFMDFLF